jgi:hypothetical protein
MSVKNNKQNSKVKPSKSNVAKTSGRSGILLKKARFNWKIAAVVGVVLVVVLGYLFVRLSGAATYDGWQRLRVVNVARSQLGQAEWSPTVLGYTEQNREPWCADFVSWVYLRADIPFETTPSPGRSSWRIPLAWKTYSGVPNLRSYFQSRGTWREAETGYVPAPGDVIIFAEEKSHTGIVEKYESSGKLGPMVYTIEGNVGDKVSTRSYSKNDSKIDGYGVTPSQPPSTNSPYKF